MSTVADALRDAIEKLRAAGILSPRLEARLLLAHAVAVAPSEVFTAKLDLGRDEALPRFESLLARRVAHEPLAYITGRKEFWSLEFAVGPGVLIPRPETETLIEQAIRNFPDRAAPLDVLDLGTGTGCLLVALLSEYPNARGLGIDSSPEALAWARRNIEMHGLGARCRLSAGDWGGDLSCAADVILSNPPYIRSADIASLAPDIGLYEPVAALDGGVDGLDAYRALAPRIAGFLKPDGMAFLEIGAGQGDAVQAILAANGLEIREIAPDLAGIGRCVIAGRKAGPEKTVGTTGRNR